ncbi:hypothetical protein D9756_009986 [Leucocoprinus leucothites]|uniref:F-box domain-containing protein n=1 Tax=Leucocoprinus leucothites TaxID=201217 RepID=A0A8H5CSK9_9AGAR|nr:hypothetical protein D9756_009986 [Leucoagaricus leucothites]
MPYPPPVSKSLLRISYPTTGNVAATARTSLKEDLDRLQVLESNIARLQARSSSLSLERQSLRVVIENYQSILSPINNLPSDVLQEIFYHCLPVAHNVIMSINEPPLLLGRVCKRWRDVAFSTPRLWNSLHIVAVPLTFLTNERKQAILGNISSWLARSGVLPLSISLYHDSQSPTRGRTKNPEVQPYLDVIIPHSRRWKSICFILRDINWLEIFSQFHANDVPELESLHIKDNYYSTSWTYPEEPVSTAEALAREGGILRGSRLRSLDLPSYIAHTLGDGMRWWHLTALHIAYWTFPFEDFARIASQCPNLIECTIRLSYVRISSSVDDGHGFSTPTSPSSLPMITLPALRNLTIHARPNISDDTVVRDLFDHISAPSLIHLTWERSTLAEPWPYLFSSLENDFVQSLAAFLEKLVDPLEELDLWLNPVSQDTLIKILRCVPKLKRLSLEAYTTSHSWGQFDPSPDRQLKDGNLILQQLIPGTTINGIAASQTIGTKTESSSVTSLCPNLEIVYFPRARFSYRLLLEFIHSRTSFHRRNGVTCLRNVTGVFSHTPQHFGHSDEGEEFDIQAEIIALENDTGVQVYLEYPRQLEGPPAPLPSAISYEGITVADSDFLFQPFF